MEKFGLKIDITNQCNLNCEYCYVDKGDKHIVSITQINAALNAIRNLDSMFTKRCTFFGGEPSLAHNLIKYIIDNNSDFSFNIISNGYRLFHKDDIDFYKLFNSVTITLEGTELSYNKLRGEHSLTDKIQQVIKMKKTGIKVNVNMSLNGLLLSDMDEFIENVHELVKNNIYVLLYSIKGDNHFRETDEYVRFLSYLRLNAFDIYRNIIKLNDNVSDIDTNFLCSFDNCVTLSSYGKIITCTMENEVLGEVNDLNSYAGIIKKIPQLHKSLWVGCSNCEVPIGFCGVSCPAYISECYKSNKLDELNHVCEFERIKEFFRRKELDNGDKVSHR